MNKEEFQSLLEEIKQNEYKFKNVDLTNLLTNLYRFIGDKDPILRDGLVYPVFAHLLHDNVLEKEQLKNITKKLLSNEYLLFDLDNDIELSVLIRSFSMLQLTILLYVHNRDSLFDENEITDIYNGLIDYFKKETDVRGFIEDAGFLHSVAHAVDTFKELVKAKEIKDYQLKTVMDVIQTKFDTSDYQFIHDEDERTVNVLEEIIKQNKLEKEYLLLWIENTADYNRPKVWPQVYNANRNIKSLLRSLYFRFINDEEYTFLTDKIKEVLLEKVKLR